MVDIYHSNIYSKKAAFWLFLIGLFSETQISLGGKIGISELIMVVCAPYLFLTNFFRLQKDGVLWFFILIIAWLLGALYIDLTSHNYVVLMLKGIAVPICTFANVLCIYLLLKRNPLNLRYFLIGGLLSGIISIFIFQHGMAGNVAAEEGMLAGVERLVSYKLFWVNLLSSMLTLPITAWYIKTPKAYSFAALGIVSVVSIVSGGRSAFLISMASLFLLIFGGKNQYSLKKIKRHFLTVVIMLAIVGVLCKVAYKYAAESGIMGEEEQSKYERQSSQGSGFGDFIRSGRAEFFIGLTAALDKPFSGHGSVAIDDYGYVVDYLHKYGTPEDVAKLVTARATFGIKAIPGHSHIVTYWMWHGIFALVFWMSAIVLVLRTLLIRAHVIPDWYGFLAISIPAFTWNVFFSPFGGRVGVAALFAVALIIRGIEKNKMFGVT